MLRAVTFPTRHFLRDFARFLTVAAALGVATTVFCQSEMYPTKEGIEQAFHVEGMPKWMSFDMELRSRTEEQTTLNYVNNKDRFYELTRVRGGLEIRPSSWLTLYAQFHDLHALGLPLRDVASNMRDNFDLRQGYLEFHYKDKAQLFAGRQELKFGDERVVGISDWTQTSRTWDAFRLHLAEGKSSVDMFTSSVVQIHPTSMDTHGAGLTFHGLYSNLAVSKDAKIMPFVFVRAYPRVLSQQGRYGSETETTFGSEWDLHHRSGFITTGMGDLQRGSYSNDSIHSGAAIVRAGYVADKLPWRPQIVGEYDYSTGNPHRNPLRIGTYDQQYPSNHNAFGLTDLFGFQNMKQDRLHVSLAPTSNLMMLFEGESLHVASIHDGVYNGAAGSLVTPPAGGFLHDGIGTEVDGSAKYIFHKSFVTNVGIGHFFPGYVMASRSHGEPLTLAYVQFTYRFKVGK